MTYSYDSLNFNRFISNLSRNNDMTFRILIEIS